MILGFSVLRNIDAVDEWRVEFGVMIFLEKVNCSLI